MTTKTPRQYPRFDAAPMKQNDLPPFDSLTRRAFVTLECARQNAELAVGHLHIAVNVLSARAKKERRARDVRARLAQIAKEVASTTRAVEDMEVTLVAAVLGDRKAPTRN